MTPVLFVVVVCRWYVRARWAAVGSAPPAKTTRLSRMSSPARHVSWGGGLTTTWQVGDRDVQATSSISVRACNTRFSPIGFYLTALVRIFISLSKLYTRLLTVLFSNISLSPISSLMLHTLTPPFALVFYLYLIFDPAPFRILQSSPNFPQKLTSLTFFAALCLWCGDCFSSDLLTWAELPGVKSHYSHRRPFSSLSR